MSFRIKTITVFLFVFLISQQLINIRAEGLDDQQSRSHDLLNEIEINELEMHWSQLNKDYRDYIPNIEQIKVKDLISNHHQLTFIDWLLAIFNMIGHELIVNGKLLGYLIIITIIAAIIKNIQSSFQSESVTVIANFVLMILLMTLAVQSFITIIELIITTIIQIHDFIISLLPLILGFMIAMGGVISASFSHPIIVTSLYLITTLADKVVLNLIFFSLILHLISQMNPTMQLTQLADLLRKFALSVLFICVTIFFTVLSTQGAVTAVQDGLAIKTTKFVTNNFVPVVGRMFSEATDTIFATTQVLKNGLGLFGFIFILIMVSLPIIKVAVVALMYRLAAAIIQPVGEEQIGKSISIISDHIFYLLAVLLVVSFMFLITIVILLIASNLTLMIR